LNAKFTYVGMGVKDLEESIDFYSKLLDMKLKGMGKPWLLVQIEQCFLANLLLK